MLSKHNSSYVEAAIGNTIDIIEENAPIIDVVECH